MQSVKKVLIVAGEASGDLVGSELAKALLAKDPALKLIGMGSQKMQAAGVDILVNCDKLAVVGFFEAMSQFNKIRKAMNKLKSFMVKSKPDLVILIDYPGCNLRLAKFAKLAGLTVMYYVSPQIWAWHYSRIKNIKRYVDHMAVFFPFEEKIYQREQVPVTLVGHPIVDAVKPSLSKLATYQALALNPDQPIIALLPGSRRSEIKRLLPVINQSVELIKAKLPNAQFMLALANSLADENISQQTHRAIKVVRNNTYNLLNVSSAAITASGTATLEISLLQVPMLILYKANALTYQIGKRLIKLTHLGLCNLLGDKPVAREFIQNAAKPQAIAQETLKLLQDETYRQTMLSDLANIKTQLGSGGASQRAATIAYKFLSKKTQQL